MTEIDAHDISILDLDDAHQRLSHAKGPADVVNQFAQFLIHRAAGFEDGVGEATAREAFRYPPNRQTLSETIAAHIEVVLNALQPVLPPEDLRAYLMWLAGAPEVGPGFVQQFLQGIDDAGAGAAIAHIQNMATSIRGALDADDTRIFGDAKANLTEPEWSIVSHILADARLVSIDGDGETARSQLIQARKLAETFTRRNLEARRLFDSQPIRRVDPDDVAGSLFGL